MSARKTREKQGPQANSSGRKDRGGSWMVVMAMVLRQNVATRPTLSPSEAYLT